MSVFAPELSETWTLDPPIPAVAVLVSAQVRRSVPSRSVPSNVQPEGVDIAVSLLAVTNKISTSPGWTELGTTTEGIRLFVLVAAAARKATDDDGGSSAT